MKLLIQYQLQAKHGEGGWVGREGWGGWEGEEVKTWFKALVMFGEGWGGMGRDGEGWGGRG